jgi:hypothetical protein
MTAYYAQAADEGHFGSLGVSKMFNQTRVIASHGVEFARAYSTKGTASHMAVAQQALECWTLEMIFW